MKTRSILIALVLVMGSYATAESSGTTGTGSPATLPDNPNFKSIKHPNHSGSYMRRDPKPTNNSPAAASPSPASR